MMVLGGATACTDFIEIDPENKVPEQGVDFTNKNNMYQPVVGAYSKVRTQGMHWCNALLMFTRDGDVWSGRTDDQGDAVAFGRKFNYNNSFWALNQVWMNFYDIIRITNAAKASTVMPNILLQEAKITKPTNPIAAKYVPSVHGPTIVW